MKEELMHRESISGMVLSVAFLDEMKRTDLLAKMTIAMFAQKSCQHNALQKQMTHLHKSTVYACMFCNGTKVYSNPEVCNLPSMRVRHATI